MAKTSKTSKTSKASKASKASKTSKKKTTPRKQTSLKTIQWTCEADPGWQWLSAMGNPPQGFPVDNDPIRTGTIQLLPYAGFWYSCVDLIDQGTTTANTFLNYCLDSSGNDCVKAYAVAQGVWFAEDQGSQSCKVSEGGITLSVEIID
jgi:hypothetical protein